MKRWRITLEDGRVLYVYALDKETARAKVPAKLPKPPMYVTMAQVTAVASVELAGPDDVARLVADGRRAPGS